MLIVKQKCIRFLTDELKDMVTKNNTIIRDITEQKDTERKIQQLNESLEKQDMIEDAKADANKKKIKEAYKHFNSGIALQYPSLFGHGQAAEFICEELSTNLN